MKKITIEVSDNSSQYSHFIGLAVPLISDRRFEVTFFVSELSVKIQFIDYLNKYLNGVVDIGLISENTTVLSYSLLDSTKRHAINISKKLGSEFIFKSLRKFYQLFRNNDIESGDAFYKKNIDFFKKHDVVITTELKGGESLKSVDTKLVWLLHGIISNHYPYKKDWRCDLVVSPQKDIYNLISSNTNFPETAQIFPNTYVKFNSINLINETCRPLFCNENHTFFYNPHWDNSDDLSSWFYAGLDILEFFISNPQFNLIFAPHINLDKFCSINLDDKFYSAENIIIDLDSDKLINGSYFPYINTYIGDVSSQFFEVASYNDISAIFINFSARENVHFSYWDSGDVVYDLLTFKKKIKEHASINVKKVNKELFFNKLSVDGIDELINDIHNL